MDINDLILSDKALEVIDNGTWVGDFPEAPGLELLVTGMNSKEARKMLMEKQQLLRTKNRNRQLTDDQLANITKEVLYEVVLKGWRGLKSGGKDVPYDPKLAKDWITSRNGEKFTNLVLEAARRVSEEANDMIEDVKKN